MLRDFYTMPRLLVLLYCSRLIRSTLGEYMQPSSLLCLQVWTGSKTRQHYTGIQESSVLPGEYLPVSASCSRKLQLRRWNYQSPSAQTHAQHSTTERKKKAFQESSPRTTGSILSGGSSRLPHFHGVASAPLGLKLIFISVVSSTFLHICSKSHYEAFVIWITLANWKVSPGKLDTEVIYTIRSVAAKKNINKIK